MFKYYVICVHITLIDKVRALIKFLFLILFKLLHPPNMKSDLLVNSSIFDGTYFSLKIGTKKDKNVENKQYNVVD